MVLVQIRNRRARDISRQLPDGIDLMVRSLRAGHPLNTAFQVIAREMPDPLGSEMGVVADRRDTTFYLGRETLIPAHKRAGMMRWRKKLFALMHRNAQSATAFFEIPPNRVVELGAQIEV